LLRDSGEIWACGIEDRAVYFRTGPVAQGWEGLDVDQRFMTYRDKTSTLRNAFISCTWSICAMAHRQTLTVQDKEYKERKWTMNELLGVFLSSRYWKDVLFLKTSSFCLSL
jgi:hypothetical protein